MAHVKDASNLRINTDIIFEEPWPISDGRKKVGKARETIRRYIQDGVESPVTKRVVQLECCFLSSGQLSTSCAALRRFEEELNGVVLKDKQ